MREFALKLLQGIHLKDVPRDKKDIVNELISLHILKNRKFLQIESKYEIGTLDINRSGTGFVTPFIGNKKDLLVESEDINGSLKGDLVIVKRFFNKSGRPKAKVVLTLDRAFHYSVGYLTHSNVKQPIIHNIKTDLPIHVTSKAKTLKKLPEGAVFKINNLTEEIEEVLGVLDDPQIDEKISLALYNKKEEFSSQALNEAQSYGDFVDKTMYVREDLTYLPFCTIDPPDAKDHDDAIYYNVKKRTLYVAIADVSEYVHAQSFIDQEAKERGFSIYFPHKSIPMLPRALSENICSLKEHEERLAFVCEITFDEKFNIKQERLFEAVIESKRKYSYETVDGFLEKNLKPQDETDEAILSWLLPLFHLTNKLRSERLEKGLDFSGDEIRMGLNEGKLEKVKIEAETPSHGLIEDCMLLANKMTAKMIDFGIFRVHDAPSEKSIESLKNDLAALHIEAPDTKDIREAIREIQKEAKELNIEKYVDKLIIRSQKQAVYAAKNSGHFALGFDTYTHFTSPIRRYSDLMLHRLLKAILRNDEKIKEFILRNIEALVVKISDLEREAARVEWDFYDRKFARWASERIGETFHAVIVDTDTPAIAKLDDEEMVGARIFLRDKKTTLFQKVKVKIIEVNIATTRIKGEVVEAL